MPPIRTPLGSISGNLQRGCELTPYERGVIIGSSISSKMPYEIELATGHSQMAVRGTIALATSRPEGASLPQSSRPIVYNDRDQRMMLKHIQLHPKSTFEERRADTGLKMSNTYIKNLAQQYSIHHWRVKKQLELTEKHAAARLL